jgi:methionyl-tRNA formyltransferase
MLLKKRTPIGAEENAPELTARLAPLGAELLCETITRIAAGTVCREKQNAAEATLAPILKKEDGLVDWQLTASRIDRRLRGFTPWPGAYTSFRGQQLSITRARPAPADSGLLPGRLRVEKRRLFAGCGEHTALELLEVQPAGKKRMTAEGFLNGYKIMETEFLGEPA